MSVSADKAWYEVAEFLAQSGARCERVLGPDALVELIPGCRSYGSVPVVEMEWVAIHKGLLEEIGVEPLEEAMSRLKPVFANDVFVVYGRGPRQVEDDPHVAPLRLKLRALRESAAAVRKRRRSGGLRSGARALTSLLHPKAPHPKAPHGGGEARGSVYLGEHTVLTRTVRGLKLFLDTRDLGLTPHLVLDGYWEEWVTRAIVQAVRPGMRTVDVGANVGYYATLLASLVGESGFVHAFEPVPRLQELLFRNLEINGFTARSRCHAAAVDARRGTVPFQLFERHLASSSMFASDAHAAAYRDRLQTIDVQAVSLDEALADDPRVDLMKIDAEGAEPFVLEGAREVLRSSPAIRIFMEFAPTFYTKEISPSDVLARVRALGFRINQVTSDGELAPIEDAELLAGPLHELHLAR